MAELEEVVGFWGMLEELDELPVLMELEDVVGLGGILEDEEELRDADEL